MLEKEIEQVLVRKVKKRGGLCAKQTYLVGIPDRLILLPGNKYAWVELKQKGKKPRASQLAFHNKLRSLGAAVYVLDDTADIDDLLDEIQG